MVRRSLISGGPWLLAAAVLLCPVPLVAHGQMPSWSLPTPPPSWTPWTRERSADAPTPPVASDAPAVPSKWFDDLSLFGGPDGAKEPEDLGVNAHFGYRFAVNWGLPLWQEIGLGLQAGTAINRSENAVRVFNVLGGPRERTQSFTTLGLFQRCDSGLKWGAVYDFRHDDYFGSLGFGQVRGQVGYAFTAADEVGAWGTLRTNGDRILEGGNLLDLRPIDQVNFFWRHVWEGQQLTRVWAGVAQSHGRFLLVAPNEGPVRNPVTFGADLLLPLSDHVAIYGEAQFITPNDTGVVTAVFGIAFYPGGGARRAATNAFAPLLPLAGNPTFSVDARQ